MAIAHVTSERSTVVETAPGGMGTAAVPENAQGTADGRTELAQNCASRAKLSGEQAMPLAVNLRSHSEGKRHVVTSGL